LKKNEKKLSLNRETLTKLQHVVGGTQVDVIGDSNVCYSQCEKCCPP
jgi:hypothetical protein